MVKTYRVHPAIGIARVGNSDEYFLAPESMDDPPQEKYKVSDGVIKRQAVRFRVFEYVDGVPVREVFHQGDGHHQEKVAWRAHLANRKAAFEKRNPDVKQRRRLVIDAGPEIISGKERGPHEMTGTFQCRAAQPVEVLLGELRTDPQGRLTVLGGKGRSFSPTHSPIGSGIENNDWCDDTSDGPVHASVYLPGTGWVEAESAWVVVAPPDFAPAVQPMTTVYDVVYQLTRDKFGHDYDPLLPKTVSFKRHVYPLLARSARDWWVRKLSDCKKKNFLDPDVLAKLKDNSPKFKEDRQKAWKQIQEHSQDPTRLEEALRQAQEEGGIPRKLAGAFPIPEWRAEVMERWCEGEFKSDWDNPEPEPPTLALDKTGLDTCYGYYLQPGIELPQIIENPATWRAPFRIDGTTLRPGDLTAGLVVPWQADYGVCRSGWQAVRPETVFVKDSERQPWNRNVQEVFHMLREWAHMGFVLQKDAGVELFLEKERDLPYPSLPE